MLKDLLDRARKIAEQHLPEDVLDAGRKLGRTVAAHAPAPLAEVIDYVIGEDAKGEGKGDAASKAAAPSTEPAKDAPASTEAKVTAASSTEAPSPEPAKSEAPSPEPAKSEAASTEPAKSEPAKPEPTVTRSIADVRREDPSSVLERVLTKAERGLKPEDRLVVVYATPDEEEEVRAIMEILATVEAEVRQNDLRREPQTARQLAKLTGVMVPPYVFINGRHWGNRYDLESLAAWGDLPLVVANILDEISPEARRMGNVHESFSDEISVGNILTRWKLGHILCVDDLDSWYELGREQEERFFYQGGPHPVADMPNVAVEIVRAVEAGEIEAVWQLEPSVQLP
jgi:glutaredoxin